MTGQELELCPFCRGEAWLNDYDALHDGRPPQSRCPQCKSCGCNLGYLPTAEKAVAAWNTRAPVTVQDAAQIERLAFAMWKAEADRAAPNVGRNRTPEMFSGELEATRAKWICLAIAALRAITEGK